MDLYYTPLSCSLASKIALAEAGVEAKLVRVRSADGAKSTERGENFLEINPRGQVPTMRMDDGAILTENVAILEYIAELNPDVSLGLAGAGKHQVRRWLGFVNSELHTPGFGALFNSAAPDGAKAHGLAQTKAALAYLDEHLEGREWLASEFSVADIYLAVSSNWTQAVKIDLGDYPNVKRLRDKVFARPKAGPIVAKDVEMYQAA